MVYQRSPQVPVVVFLKKEDKKEDEKRQKTKFPKYTVLNLNSSGCSPVENGNYRYFYSIISFWAALSLAQVSDLMVPSQIN